MAMDVSGLCYFMPVFGFLFVFTIVYALLAKTKIFGKSDFLNIFIGFFVAIGFITAASFKFYSGEIGPWFAVLIVTLLLALVMIGFDQKRIESVLSKPFMIALIVLMIVSLLFSGVMVFSSMLTPFIKTIGNQEKAIGAILLLFTTIVTAWILAKK